MQFAFHRCHQSTQQLTTHLLALFPFPLTHNFSLDFIPFEKLSNHIQQYIPNFRYILLLLLLCFLSIHTIGIIIFLRVNESFYVTIETIKWISNCSFAFFWIINEVNTDENEKCEMRFATCCCCDGGWVDFVFLFISTFVCCAVLFDFFFLRTLLEREKRGLDVFLYWPF